MISFMLQFFSPQMQLPHLGTKFTVTAACFLNTGQFSSSMPSTVAVEKLILAFTEKEGGVHNASGKPHTSPCC